MFPFNIDRALRGEPLVCRDGRRPGMCFANKDADYPIRVILPSGIAPFFTASGRRLRGLEDPSDLFMLERKPWTISERLQRLSEQVDRAEWPDVSILVDRMKTLFFDIAAQEASR